MKAPQADDVIKLQDLPLGVANGANKVSAIALRYGFTKRQALYYIRASELLGFVKSTKDIVTLTSLGRKYVAISYQQRKELFIRQMLAIPIFYKILVDLVILPNHTVTTAQMRQLVSKGTGISGTTITRRTQTIFSWIGWLSKEIPIFAVTQDSIRLEPSKGSMID